MVLTPLMINLADKQVVIIGGGSVAERRVLSLKESGAVITLVSPEITDRLHSLRKRGLLRWKQKHFQSKDIHQAFLVIAATNDPEVNQSIKNNVPQETLLNIVDDGEKGDTEFPGTFRQGRLTISVSTGGASPILTSKIRKNLESMYGHSYGNYVDFLYVCRKLIKQSTLEKSEKKALLNDLLSKDFLNIEKQRDTLEFLRENLD
ncbi:NAD(P)-binding protein [Oceanobacillus senegalensis]|uniref:NAD(P)-binding protein n=1 Tax=Oceanobacillus senegalensis TaxID=1936063 RepID=UPI000A309683|nr:NAD(P)-binding protein [Oceanobacillus senegalensis]